MKYCLLCTGCKGSMHLELTDIKRLCKIEIKWVCKYCDKINTMVVIG